MIRLKNILLEYEDSHEEMLNVLFVVDDESLKRSGFIRHIISQRVVVGDIESADKQNTEALKDLTITNASPELDLIVIVSRGIYDDDPVDVIRNFEIIQQYADTIDVPVVYFTLPTIRFIEDTKDISNNWTEIERLKVNNVIRNKFNDVISLSNFDQDEYFRKDGITYNLNAHLTLYKLLFRKILNYDSTAQVKTNIVNIACDVTKLQKKLLSLDFDIDIMEIAKKQYATTQQAVDELREKLGYPPSEELTKNLCKAIMLIQQDDEKIIVTRNKEKQLLQKCPNPKYPGARQQYAPDVYRGSNGVAERIPSLQTVTDKFGNTVTLNRAAADQYVRMMFYMNEAGISTSQVFSFRSYQRQYDMFDWDLYECTGQKKSKEGNDQALPGTSNHGEGLAIDISGTSAQNWLKENGKIFGWWWGEAKTEDWHFTFNQKYVNMQAQKDLGKGTIEKGVDAILNVTPGGEYIKMGKDAVKGTVGKVRDFF
jgi:LAS superfamily LD-carboxypeptidase LdcB